MAIDVYRQIEGIKGESADSAHIGWIEVDSANWGVTQPKSATASTAGGHTAERCEHRTLSISKLADGDGNRVKYYEVELENVLVASMQQLVSAGSILHDSIGLRFSRVRWKYTQQKITGGGGGNTTGGWDLSTNRIV